MTTLKKFFGVGAPTVAIYSREATGLINPDLVVGFELETENCDAISTNALVSKADTFQINIERDGSLRGTAYEFISRPMRSKHALAAVEDFWSWAKFTEENYSDRCSVHVHVNCTDMQMEQISNVTLLYTIAEEILFEYVGGHRDSNIYCIPWSQCRAHFDLVQGFLTRPEYPLKKWNKYTALNLLPLTSIGTVEFRQMHGTADIEKLTRWVNIIGAIFKWAKEVSLKDLVAEIKTLNTNSQYETFFTRLIGGQLPYNEDYRSKLEAGVIFAKYSLISMSRPKGKEATVEVTPEPQAAVPRTVEATQQLQEAIARLRGEDRLRAAPADVQWRAVPATRPGAATRVVRGTGGLPYADVVRAAAVPAIDPVVWNTLTEEDSE